MLVVNTLMLLAFRKVIPALYEAAASGSERQSPSPPWWQDAVRSVPQRYWPLPGAGVAVLEDGVHKGQSGFRRGNVASLFTVKLC